MYVLTEHEIRRNRRRLLLLISCLMVPFFLAWIMVRFEVWLPAQTINKGDFLAGKEPLHRWPWQSEQGFPENLKQQWLLVLVTPDTCTESCSQWQQNLQQIHKALGKEGDRVRRVLLQPVSAGNTLPQALEGMGSRDVLRWHGLTMSTPDWLARPWLKEGYQVLIVDPMGNLVTGYADSNTGRDLLRDLRRLLRASATG